jgi:hypothetical protein
MDVGKVSVPNAGYSLWGPTPSAFRQANPFSGTALWVGGKVTDTELNVRCPAAGKYSLVVSNRTGFLWAVNRT